ncbi:type 2 periplasmic-binding domain-containing protein [Brachybacterium nesterenkovii]|uniref:Transcriptional regulator, LysR family, putative n=1 Tax=Brachybacterium nesterenkovii TaxID=47847 RepID=A0A1X6X855_9MICO|nr:hypothetical protein [Brachybacterium nesterenkovii]SLM95336.1 transcriptional regulator, LysR family, putative [Brachybacterium nesterenkovii]
MAGRTGGRGGRGAAAGRGSGRAPGPAKGAAGSVGRPTGRDRTAQDGASTTRRGRTGATREAVRVDAPTPPEPRTLRVGFVPGVEPDRFARRWSAGERRDLLDLRPVALSAQETALTDGTCDMCFMRLPLSAALGASCHIVELWEERPAIVVGDEHVLSVLDEIRDADLVGETEIGEQHPDDAADRVAVAASGAGFACMPLSLARLHHRKDAVHRPHLDGAPTRIALVWPRESDDDLRQEFVGVVRGRTVRSSRRPRPDGA